MTLDEVSRAGDLVTEAMDQDANVIWGARVTEDMKGRLTVMTIVTGVQSQWILGQNATKQRKAEQAKLSDELGIELLS